LVPVGYISIILPPARAFRGDARMDLTRPAVQKYFSSPDHHTFFSSRVFSRKTRA
jgi:hypothetical protein